jgi:hypothetical protein
VVSWLVVHAWFLVTLHLLSLKHGQLLLLALVQDVHGTLSWWDSSREVGQLVQLIKILSSLEQDLLAVSHVVIWVQVGVSQDGHVLLQVSDLVVRADELLRLLLNQ